MHSLGSCNVWIVKLGMHSVTCSFTVEITVFLGSLNAHHYFDRVGEGGLLQQRSGLCTHNTHIMTILK